MKKLILLGSLLFFSSCLYHKDSPTPSSSCLPTATVSYQHDIVPLLQKECLSCHSERNHSGGVMLETYEEVKVYATAGEFYDSIVSINGYSPRMPQGGQLSECNVELIKKWIDAGILNN